MARQHGVWGAARRHKVILSVAIAVLVLAAGGGVGLATRSTSTGHPSATRPAPPPRTRLVALGDSVAYGHGLANPFATPQIGLPSGAVDQGPSRAAYPSLVDRALRLTMTVRSANCPLAGDQLAISGATAAEVDGPGGGSQCTTSQGRRDLSHELTAADLVRRPARLVMLQAGADDIDFAACLEFDLTEQLGHGIGLGTQCVNHGVVTSAIAQRLAHVTTALTASIAFAARHASTVAVLNYYQPIPSPGQLAHHVAITGSGINLVCAGLRENPSTTYAAAQVVSTALNGAIADAVRRARGGGATNVTLIDISKVAAGHGICTGDPDFFSAESMSEATLGADVTHIVAAKLCSVCANLTGPALLATQDLERHVWRAAHPTASGQEAIARAVEHQLLARL
jgi:lysophospholipase L1-like esterase